MRSSTSARRSSSRCTQRTCQATWASSLPTASSITSSPRIQEVRGAACRMGWPQTPGLGAADPRLSWAADITTELAYLTRELKADPCVAHALALRAAWALGNYHRFFRLYCHAPCMSGYLVDKFADRERKAALKAMIKTYVKLGSPLPPLLCRPCRRLPPPPLVLHTSGLSGLQLLCPGHWSPLSVSSFYAYSAPQLLLLLFPQLALCILGPASASSFFPILSRGSRVPSPPESVSLLLTSPWTLVSFLALGSWVSLL